MEKESVFYWHWQNLNDGARSRSLEQLWRNGRAWFNFRKFGAIRIEWRIFGRSSTALSFSFAGEEDDLQFHVGFYRLFSIWLTFSDVPILRRLFEEIRSFHGYETGVRFFDYAVWLDLCMNDAWGSRQINWINRIPGLGGWAGITYKDQNHWHGIQVNVHYLDILLGREQHSEQVIGEPVECRLELHPDTTWLGRVYKLNIQMKEHSWKRPRWFVTEKRVRADVQCNPPIPIPGKGESDWDLDDDALHGGTFNAISPEEAVQAVKRSVIETRAKYGLPDGIQLELEAFK